MYPNQYCHQCHEPEPCVELPAPPDCTGEPCEEIVLDTCVRYTGPAIPCLGITTGQNINQVLQIIANRLCDCCDGTPPVVDCQVSDWSAWSECVDGVQTRTRTVIQEPQNGGTACPDLIETRECCTPVDCVVSDWSAWSNCVGGQQTRTRTVVTPASCGGVACPTLTETRSCCLPVDCVVSDWSAWSVCDGIERTRTRTVITPASCGGAPCPVLIETESCTINIPCPTPEFGVTSDACDTFVVTVGYNSAEPSVTMEYQAVGAPTWTIGGALTTTLAGPNTITVGGLIANTTYNVRVKTKCSLGDSSWITQQITTPECVTECPAPVNLDYIEVCDHTTNGVTATASVTGASALSLTFELFNVTAGNILVDTQVASVPGGGSGSVDFFNIGLIAGDDYKIVVTTTCENFGISTSAQITFNKAACKPAPLDCLAPTNLTAS